jgi:hypothetical protein
MIPDKTINTHTSELRARVLKPIIEKANKVLFDVMKAEQGAIVVLDKYK